MPLDELRIELEQTSPIVGAIVWLIVTLLSIAFDEQIGPLILLFGSGEIFLSALLIRLYVVRFSIPMPD